VDVAGDFLEVVVCIDQEGMVAALVEMARAPVPPIVPAGVRDVEMTHELLEIPPGGVHQHVGQDLRLVNVRGASQQSEKGRAVGIRGKDKLAGVTAAGDMVVRVLVLDS